MHINYSEILKRVIAEVQHKEMLDPSLRHPIDSIILRLLSLEDCHAGHIMNLLLTKREFDLFIMKISQTISAVRIIDPDVSIDKYVESLCEPFLAATNRENLVVNTGLFLIMAIQNCDTATALYAAQAGLTISHISDIVDDLPSDEDYYTHLRTLREISLMQTQFVSITPLGTNSQYKPQDEIVISCCMSPSSLVS